MCYIIEKIEEQLESSLSTSMFTKDIDNMRKMYSAPIKYNREEKGYCYTEPNFSINSFPLSHEEIEALDFSTALLQQLKNTPMFHHFETAINKVIEGYRICKILGKPESQLLQVEEPVKVEGSIWLDPLLKAIVNKNCLKISYQGFGKLGKDHLLSAYLLKEYRNRWYVIGYSATAKNIRVFALDRIKDVSTVKDKYFVNNNFDPEAYFLYSFGITQVDNAPAEKVDLLFAPSQAPYILSQPLHHSQQTVSNDENGLRVQLLVYLTPELIMAILSYAEHVKVLAPENLQNQIKAHIQEMGKRYQG